MKLAEEMRKDDVIVVTLSGRGDKDVEIVQHYLNKNKSNKKKKTKNAK
jgi:tryptophan synthase beta chain